MTGDITIGTLVDADGDAPAALRATRFNRHTFWCGQSGSGKTYALGVVLERLLLGTHLPMLVLDPNADFVRLWEVRDETDPETAAALGALDVRVLRPRGVGGTTPLHARYVDMTLRARAAVLQIDPVRDAAEYNVLLHLDLEAGPLDTGQLVRALEDSDDPVRHALLRRLENLGVLGWDVWALGATSVEDVVDERPRATVMDLGGFHEQQEAKVAALAVLDHLWATREERKPMLIVIDEAHNLCRPDPESEVEAALTERIVQIAAEGRKYGLWLVLSTQRPSKVHVNALSQCDNLALMRMSSPRDLAELGDVFGYAPADLLAASPHFLQGQALFAGGFVSEASVVQVAARWTHEGGADVAVPL
jgi:DNA helicase HerA-like ATPase